MDTSFSSTTPSACADEHSWIAAWQSGHDRRALQHLISAHMSPIRAWARRGPSSQTEDLVAEGVIALIEAASRHRPQPGVPFAAAAYPAVRGAILRARSRFSSPLAIPERQMRDVAAGRLVGSKADLIRQAMQVEDFDESLGEQLTPPAEEAALERERRLQLRRAVAQALRPLAREERRLVLHHLLHQEGRIEEVADRMHLSVAHARRLETRALHKMRNTLMLDGFMMSDLV